MFRVFSRVLNRGSGFITWPKVGLGERCGLGGASRVVGLREFSP